MFLISLGKKRNENNGWNNTTIYCGFETNWNPYIVVCIELEQSQNPGNALLYADKAVMQKQSIASVYRDRQDLTYPVGLFLSLHRPGFTLDTSLSYDLGMELQATFLCTTKKRRACQGFPETLLLLSPVVLFVRKNITGFQGLHPNKHYVFVRTNTLLAKPFRVAITGSMSREQGRNQNESRVYLNT